MASMVPPSAQRLVMGSVALVGFVVGCSHDDRREVESNVPAAAAGPLPAASTPLTFAVLSDLHIPRDGRIPAKLERVVAAVIASHPRFVVITGDFTDGNPFDPKWRIQEAPRWWAAVRQALAPVRAAGIPVLPIAGNHDSYLATYRADYANAWRDLDAWAAPLEIPGKQPLSARGLDAAPFSYSLDVDGVHLTLAHVVDEELEPEVARWIVADLAASQKARVRIVFGHVPLASVAAAPRESFVATFGRILGNGHADLYVAGHEHLIWDEDLALPTHSQLRQVIVTTAAAGWRFAPGPAARERAQCSYEKGTACCTMPHGRRAFELRHEHGEWYETQAHGFTLFTVDGRDIVVHPIAIADDGSAAPFGRGLSCASG